MTSGFWSVVARRNGALRHAAVRPARGPAAGRGLPKRLAGQLERRAGLPDDLVHDLADAGCAVEDREVVDALEGLGRRPHDLRQLLGELLADDRVGLLLQRLGAAGDRLGLG